MLFNSSEFLFFFLFLFLFYWIAAKNSLKLQNYILLIGSYLFYGWSDWRLLSYLVGASAINFYIGIEIEKTNQSKHKQWWLYLGLTQGIGGLAFFKYFNFFINSFKDTFHQMGINLNVSTLNLIIPIGISFFTFKTISYLLDINKGKMKACSDWVSFFNYVSFFPTILSGPIDRARNFIPQLEKKRVFEYKNAMIGIRQILWGLFKKVVVADTLNIVVSDVFTEYHRYNSITLLFGAVIYSFQMYADFCGYSDMAIGIGKLLGFEVTPNFNYPFYAENIAEYWRRWHISLTSWLTEYVFTPLSITFRDFGQWGLILAIVINFTIIGIWHGANWTFVLFGFLHGCYYIPMILNGTFNKKKKNKSVGILPTLNQYINTIGTFLLVSLTLVLFRSNTIGEALSYYKGIFNISKIHSFNIEVVKYKKETFIGIFLVLTLDFWHSRDIKPFKLPKLFSYLVYIFIGILILLSLGKEESFIYFKF